MLLSKINAFRHNNRAAAAGSVIAVTAHDAAAASSLAAAVAASAAPRRTAHLTEAERVAELPVVQLDTTDLTPSLRTALWGAIQLRPIQSAALRACKAAQGLLAPIGVGHGKSLIALLCGTVLGAKRAIVLCPARTKKQLTHTFDIARKHFKIVPTIILSYDQLSRPTDDDLLQRLTQGLDDSEIVIVCDEAHKLKNRKSARTIRLLRFMTACKVCGKAANAHGTKNSEVTDHKPEPRRIRFCAMSGTLTSDSLTDFAHIAELALREGSPLPRDTGMLADWAACLDADGRPSGAAWNAIMPLWHWHCARVGLSPLQAWRLSTEDRRTLARKAFAERLRTAPGVVCTAEQALGTALEIEGISLAVPAAVDEAMRKVRETDCDPAGEPLPDQTSTWRVLRQLSAGFYYVWDWPKSPDGRPIIDLDWLNARREYNRAVRRELTDFATTGYDSPLLVWNRIIREARELPKSQLRAIHAKALLWDAQRHKRWGTEHKPPTLPVWIDRYLIDDAASWLRKQKQPALLWYDSQAVADALVEAGVKVFRAGTDPLSLLKGTVTSCALSVRSHATGLDLQSWSNQRIIEPMSGGTAWEQLLGRTHRPGQKADEVVASIYQHTDVYRESFVSARKDARYIEDTSGNEQKLNKATYVGTFAEDDDYEQAE